ncbi:YccF domain-containing protein [Indioceanicola profundi]|uniref:YccF domain-containing protein n=1 Tax=Indioceanicola profundi TaxID=2220096 RepID=UPI000E6AD223|nr:YccF domain-containing protein [Indioceanicola profundi]
MLALILNIVWILMFGWNLALAWFLAGIIMILTIVGIPWARAAFTIGLYMLWPFGRTAVNRDRFYGEEDVGTGPLGLLGNIVWFVFAGWWLAIGHVVAGVGLFITIIGIPFGWQHFKFAGLSLAPIGKTIVDRDMMDQLRYGRG